jgi:hypothetical protein
MHAALALGDDRLNLANKPPAARMLHADSGAAGQSEKCRIVRTEIALAEMAEDERQIAEDAILGVSVDARACVLNFLGIKATHHTEPDLANLKRLVAQRTMCGLHGAW